MMKTTVSKTQRMLNVWAIVMILWAGYRAYFQVDLPLWFDELVAKPLVFLVPVIYYVISYEKDSLWKAIGIQTSEKLKDVLIGLGVGSIFFISAITMQLLRRGSASFLPHLTPNFVMYFTIIAFATSISEEILSRGFVLKRLYAESKSIPKSVALATFLFFFIHIPIILTNPQLYGVALAQVIVTDILLSIAVSLFYLQRRSVIVPILIHACYNLSLYLLR